MLKNRTKVLGAVLVGAVLTGVLIWDWNRTPSTFGLGHAASGDNPKASLKLLSPGILSIALESGNTHAAGLGLQGDGTIVVGATVVSTPASDKSSGVVLRLTPNGRFANPAVTLLADTPTIVSGVSIARDGTIMATGYGSSSDSTNRHFLLARLLPDGALDPAFGGGVVLANLQSSMWLGETARAVAVQGDDRIVATGSAGYATSPLSQASYCATARFSGDGRIDRSFGDNGRVLTLVAGKQMCGASSVLVEPDGKIVVVGDYASEREPRHIAVLRYLPDGAPDSQFGQNGIAHLAQMSANAWGAALDSHGRVVVVGTEWLAPSGTRFLVVRFDADGNLDQSFGASGTVSLHDAVVSQELLAAALQQDGKIVAVGTFGWHSRGRSPEPGRRDQIAVVRLDPNGALDKSFAGGGLLLMASPRYLWGGHGIAIQPDGKLLIVGDVIDEANDHATSEIVLVRLNADGTPDADFGNGVDAP